MVAELPSLAPASGRWLDSFDGVDAIDRPVEGRHTEDLGGLGARNEIRLSEVESINLVDLDRAEE